MIIKSWFLNKNYSQNERYAINLADSCTIERETEKPTCSPSALSSAA